MYNTVVYCLLWYRDGEDITGQSCGGLDADFLKVVSSAIVDKYIGESARLIREMFGEWIRSEFYIDTLS